MAQKQFGQSVAGTHQITTAVLPGTDEIPRCFLLDAGDRHLYDLAQMQQSGQMASVAGIGLHPVTNRTLQFRGRSHRASDPGRIQPTCQPETGWTRFIGDRHRTRQIVQPRHHFAVIRGQPALENLARVAIEPARNDRSRVHI
jgi:hypothetical protein